ncbi:cytochrome b [Ensifer soli]|uniref:cytochrome b n=1 Tax=Ciceribacter sp. sgz301302 TaxID=3342379 RepID=UPI0035B7BC3E
MAVDRIPSVRPHAPALRVLHWIVAALVFATWPLGLMIGFAREDVKLGFFLVHESLGFLVFWLMLVRVGVKLTTTAPPPLGSSAENRVAGLVHGLIYVLLVVTPLAGFLATNAHGFPLVWFGLVPVWSPIGKTPDVAWTLSSIHEWCAWIVLVLVALHIAAAIFHHVLRRDGTLLRIL